MSTLVLSSDNYRETTSLISITWTAQHNPASQCSTILPLYHNRQYQTCHYIKIRLLLLSMRFCYYCLFIGSYQTLTQHNFINNVNFI